MTTLPALTRAQVRSVDKTAIEEYGIPGVVLMENAGSNAAKIIHQIVPEGPIEILCGGGNNAGDGYVIARHLQLMGREVQMICAAPVAQLRGDAHINAMVAPRSDIRLTSAGLLSSISRNGKHAPGHANLDRYPNRFGLRYR